jgi:tRNA nucleotidyltransferase/poly(A) polymerase
MITKANIVNEILKNSNTVIFGGYVRDMIAGVEPNDIDVMTDNSMLVLEAIQSWCND